MKLKRFMAFVLSLAMVATSSSFGALDVYAAEDELLIVEDSSSDVLLDESTTIEDKSDEPLEDNSTVLQDNEPTELEDKSNVLYDDSSKDDTLQVEEDSIVSENEAVKDEQASDRALEGKLKANAGPVIQQVKVGDFWFEVDTQFAKVIRWEPENPTALMDVTVPSVIELDKETYDTPLIEGETYKREVVEILPGAFLEVEGQDYRLKSVKLGDSVKRIGAGAFADCISLTSIGFPKEMVSTSPVYGDGLIASNAFKGCTSLATVTLPEKLDTVGAGIFAGCASLTAIEIPSGWGTTKLLNDKGEEYKNVNENTAIAGPFSGCESLATVTFAARTQQIAFGMLAQCNSIKSINIPDTVTDIGVKAFYKCENLESINFGSESNLVNIEEFSFQLCTSLKAANLPKYTKTIGKQTFLDCSSMTETTIPFSIGEVGEKAYFRCISLSSLTFGDGDRNNIPEKGGKIGAYAFGGEGYNPNTGEYKSQLSELKTLTVPNSITQIGNNAFDGCNGLTVLVFEDKFDKFDVDITIGEKAFFNCTSLANVEFSDKVTLIGTSAFENCSSITSLRMPNSVTEVGKAAFKGLGALNSLKLSERLKTLGEEAFRGSRSLRQLEIPMSLEKVGPAITDGQVDEKDAEMGVFYDSGLTEVTFKRFNNDDKFRIPDHILLGSFLVQKVNMPAETTEIGDWAFCYCILLNEITIPESCNYIGGGAFGQCQNIKTLNIPDKVTTIGRSAFIYCSSLESIHLSSTLETLGEGKGDGAFESCTSLEEIVLPNTLNVIGEATFKNCQNLKTATLPAGIQKIDNELFLGCMKLAEVKNMSKDTLTEIGNSAFESCTKLSSFDDSAAGTIDFSEFEKLKSIGKRAFYGCDSVTTVSISAATETLGESVFDSCINLNTVTLGTGCKTLPVNAFANDHGLKEVVVPRTVKKIQTGAFSRDINLEKIHISKDTELEAEVFSYCDKLTIWGFDPSPAKTYADKNDIPFVHDPVYADSIKFTDKSLIKLNLKKDKNIPIPGVDIKPVNYTVDVEYTSDNESVFTVDDYTDPKTKEVVKVLNPKGEGTATLTASVQSDASGKMISDTVSVTVKKPVESITIGPGMKKDNTLNIPDTLQLSVVVKPDDATDTSVRWVSGDRSICDVDSEGVVYSKEEGETTVAAISNDDESIQCVFNIKVTNSKVKKADPSWPSNIGKPRIVGATGVTVNKAYGSEIELVSDTPGAKVYYTVNNTEPLADYEGNMDGTTKRYDGPIVLDVATFGDAAVASGVLHVNAKSIREGFQYSTPVNFVINLTKESEWGDIDPTTRTKLFQGDVTRVPQTIWFAFEGDPNPYKAGSATEVSREYEDGKKVTFNEGIRVFYGNSQLYEGRDYGIKYDKNIEIADAKSANPPTFVIKGKGGYYKGSETFTFSIVKKPDPTGKITPDKVVISGLNTTPVFTGKKLDMKDLGSVKLSCDGKTLMSGTDYVVDTTTLRKSGKFKVAFDLQGDYEGTKMSESINVAPYNLSKDKDDAKKIKVFIDGKNGNVTVPYCKTGAKPSVMVMFGDVEMLEGLDYTVKYKNNKRVSTGNQKASVVIRGKGNFKGKYVQEFVIGKQDLANVTLVANDKVVKNSGGGALKVLPILMDDGRVLSKSKDYNKFTMADCKYTYAEDGREVKDDDPIPASGTLIRVEVSITTKSTGPYKVSQNTFATYYRIINNNLKKAKVTVNPGKEFYYNESKSVQITKDDITVTLNGDVVDKANYEIVSIKNNRLIGTASAEIRGVGNYGGTRRFSFKVKARKL